MSSGLETGEESWLLFHGLLGTDWALSLELDGDGMTCAVGMEPCERRGWKHSVPLELEWSGGGGAKRYTQMLTATQAKRVQIWS